MKHKDRWVIEKSLGKGGQGEVFLVKEKSIKDQTLVRDLFNAWPANSVVFYGDERERQQDASMDMLAQIVDSRLRPQFGALKLLHHDDNARDPKRSRERAALEIQAMRKWQHPNLLALKDCDGEELWYVSEFHSGGTLDQRLKTYAGDLQGTLSAIRPLVEGVALLHRNDAVHRDIKPHNIFIESGGKLTLGDFGLIYVRDPENDRISATHSNVGTHAWMPGWAMEHRVNELRPTFDVFSLGKVIWAMVSGNPSLTLWYYDKPQNNLEALYPHQQEMRLANELFSKCIVENEKDCLQDASELLNEIDSVLRKTYHSSANVRHCRICNRGQYVELARTNGRDGESSDPPAKDDIQTYYCDFCGHIAQFLTTKLGPSTVTSPAQASESASRFIDVDDVLAKLASNFERLWSHEIEQNRPASDASKNVADRFLAELAGVVERFGESLPPDAVSDLGEAKVLLSSVYSSWRSYSKNRQEEFLSRIAGIRKRLEIHAGLE